MEGSNGVPGETVTTDADLPSFVAGFICGVLALAIVWVVCEVFTKGKA